MAKPLGKSETKVNSRIRSTRPELIHSSHKSQPVSSTSSSQGCVHAHQHTQPEESPKWHQVLLSTKEASKGPYKTFFITNPSHSSTSQPELARTARTHTRTPRTQNSIVLVFFPPRKSGCWTSRWNSTSTSQLGGAGQAPNQQTEAILYINTI